MSVTLGEHSKRTDNPRRVNRRNERDEFHVDRAIPEGSRKLVLGDNWLEAITNHHDFVWRRADFRISVIAVAMGHLHSIDWVTATATPGNDWIKQTYEVSRWQLFAARRWLKSHGFLAQVANGRSAMYTPASSDGFSHLISGDRVPYTKMADRAIYVLCLPMTAEELTEAFQADLDRKASRCKLIPYLERLSAAVDINLHPNQASRKTNPKGNYEWASPMRKAYFEAAARETAKIEAARTDLSWPRSATTDAPDEATRSFNELQAARTVIWHTPALQRFSHRYIKRVLAPAFRAGYTPRDVLLAFDYLPDGTQRRHSGFDGAVDVVRLIQARLNDWKVNGQYVYSFSQQEEVRVRDARNRALNAKPQVKEVSTDDSVFNTGIAMLRNAIRGANPLDG